MRPRDIISGGLKDYGEACYKMGFRDGVIVTLLVVVVVVLVILWFRGKKT